MVIAIEAAAADVDVVAAVDCLTRIAVADVEFAEVFPHRHVAVVVVVVAAVAVVEFVVVVALKPQATELKSCC